MKEKIKGRANLLAGGVKAKVGELMGRDDLLVDGKLQQVKGAAQMARTEVDSSAQLVSKMVKSKVKELGKAAHGQGVSRINKAAADAQQLVGQGGAVLSQAVEQAGALAAGAVGKLTETVKQASTDPVGAATGVTAAVKGRVKKAAATANQVAAVAASKATEVVKAVKPKK
jgi:uncharacterized protein YjbJ (UPF0337 family)